MKLKKIFDSYANKRYINPDHIVELKPWSKNKDWTVMILSSGETIILDNTPEEVIRQLEIEDLYLTKFSKG